MQMAAKAYASPPQATAHFGTNGRGPRRKNGLMSALRRPGFAAFGLLLLLLPGPVAAQVKPIDTELLKSLRAGGHVVVVRHATADPDKADTDPLNFRNIKTQQPLTEQGRQSARALGDTWRQLGVQFGEVLTSKFNRCYQTALLAGFKAAKSVTELTEGSLVVSPNEQRRRAAFMRQLVVAPLSPGQNRLIVTHRANIAQAFGKEWYDVKEGEASVFRVEKGSYSLLARMQLDDWSRLLLIANKS